MTPEQQLKQQLNELGKSHPTIFAMEVISVDKQKKTIKAKDDHGLEYPDVRLKAAIIEGKYVVSYPATNSSVLVGIIGGKEDELVVISCSEVEEIEGEIGNTTFIINTDGLAINGGDHGGVLKSSSLITQINKLKTRMTALEGMLVSLGVPTATLPPSGNFGNSLINDKVKH